VPVGLNAGDENAANFVLAGAGNGHAVPFDGRQVVMSRRIMADGNNIPFQLQGFVADSSRIIRVGNDRCQTALCKAKTGMPVPINFHTSSIFRFDYTLSFNRRQGCASGMCSACTRLALDLHSHAIFSILNGGNPVETVMS